MATLDIASKGTPSLVYPVSIVASFLERHGLLKNLQTTVHGGKTIDDTDVTTARLTASDGAAFDNRDIIQWFGQLVSENAGHPPLSLFEEWATRAAAFSAPNFGQLLQPLAELDAHLTLRSYIAGYDVNISDLVVWAVITSNHVAMSSIRKAENNVTRWYTYIEASNPWIKDALSRTLAPSLKERAATRAATGAAGANYDIDLPQATGPIITRFPPEPSGYLHIGHAKAALLNEYFARLREGGRLICRFDDTNPTNERVEFQDSILHDLELIGIKPDQMTYSSDYFQVMYEYAVQLIKAGKAFADDHELGKGDQERRNRLPSKRRDMSVEDTLERFNEMKSGSEEGQRWCLRARIAYDSSNGTLRDPVIYRSNVTPHHRTGEAWKIYPTYDFCAPILDSVEGVTVALRTNEYRDRNAQYEWMQEALGLRPVPIWDFSRLNMVRTVLSKRKLTRIVEDGKVWGWDDPRMPTIRGIIRRGEAVSALREFILKQGPSRNVVNMEWGVFWATNRKHIDLTAPRHTAIASSAVVTANVRGISAVHVASKPKHPKNPSLGEQKIVFSERILLEYVDAITLEEGEEITLMGWGNAFVRHVRRGQAPDSLVTSLDLDLHLQGDVKKTKKKITWLADEPSQLVPVDLVSFDYLITKDKLDKEDKLEEFLTPVTEFRTEAFADGNVAGLAQGSIIQFERKGFFKLDSAYRGGGSRAVFFEVPAK